MICLDNYGNKILLQSQFQFAGSLLKSPMEPLNETKNDQVNGTSLIMSKRKTSFNNVPTVKSFFLSETGEEEETEDDEEEIELDEETDVFPGNLRITAQFTYLLCFSLFSDPLDILTGHC